MCGSGLSVLPMGLREPIRSNSSKALWAPVTTARRPRNRIPQGDLFALEDQNVRVARTRVLNGHGESAAIGRQLYVLGVGNLSPSLLGELESAGIHLTG